MSSECRLAEDVEIGPWCVLDGAVELGPGVALISHVHIRGAVSVGAGSTLYPFVCVGFPPQDVKFKLGAPSAGVVIGEECVLREHATVHSASSTERPTVLGDRVMMMVGSHVGHDGRVGDEVVMVNAALLGGHVQVGANAVLGGGAACHQHGRVGRLAMVAGGSRCSADVPPFCMVAERNVFIGVNLIGLRRAGVDREELSLVRRVCREVFRVRLVQSEMVDRLEQHAERSAMVREILDFVRASTRPICTGSGGLAVAGARSRGGAEDW